MGARAQVFVKEAGVYLYTHWGAENIENVVSESLASDRGQARRHDPEYLARIIFEDMIDAEGGQGGETGFGIGAARNSDIQKLVTVTATGMEVSH